MAENKEVSFLIDSMLGKLAKWLRVMGYDTHYQPVYKTEDLEKLISRGRLFITKNKSTYTRYKPSLLIISNKIQDQLHEIKNKGGLPLNLKKSFSRCLLCNIKLESATINNASSYIPEYILTQNAKGVSYCPVCNRYFWPGSHRKKMLDQITQWGLNG
ncbi:Mut7-C RNAse domain-containing protein [Thermodesulfobacteriota bacterium]